MILLGFVVLQVDWIAARRILRAIEIPWLVAGLALLMVEGLLTASRFRLLVRKRTAYRDCLKATAWYVLLLIGLPARLGEVAGVATIVRYMNQPAGTAVASLLYQRVFDLIVLGALIAIGIVFVVGDAGAGVLLVLVASVVAALVAIVVWFEPLLSAIARPLVPRRHDPWSRRVLRLVLQARTTRRHHMDRTRTFRLGLYTIGKWIVNLAAIACVTIGVVPALPLAGAAVVGIVYNLAAVIPISTVGGFGISEAALMGGFSWLGYSLDEGAPIAIAIRLVLVSAPILFWAGVVGATLDRVGASSRREPS